MAITDLLPHALIIIGCVGLCGCLLALGVVAYREEKIRRAA